jgi:hypothetical protein
VCVVIARSARRRPSVVRRVAGIVLVVVLAVLASHGNLFNRDPGPGLVKSRDAFSSSRNYRQYELWISTGGAGTATSLRVTSAVYDACPPGSAWPSCSRGAR